MRLFSFLNFNLDAFIPSSMFDSWTSFTFEYYCDQQVMVFLREAESARGMRGQQPRRSSGVAFLLSSFVCFLSLAFRSVTFLFLGSRLPSHRHLGKSRRAEN